MKIFGRVTKQMFGDGTKSKHLAVMLDTGEMRYILRRQGGNPFSDPELDKLVGKTIRGTGTLTGYTFILSDWSEVNSETKK